MILSSLIKSQLRPAVYTLMNQRSLRPSRPTIKIGKDLFQISLDVHKFNKEEIRVKARSEYILVEGKHARKTDRGYVQRRFVRKFKLPPGCNPEEMESKLSPNGVLTITAPRSYCDINTPCETLVPTKYTDPDKKNL